MNFQNSFTLLRTPSIKAAVTLEEDELDPKLTRLVMPPAPEVLSPAPPELDMAAAKASPPSGHLVLSSD